MKLYKATDEIAVDHPTILIVSDPGVGKTTLGYGAEKALLLDADLGAHRAKNRRETMQPESWKDIEEIVDGKRDKELKDAFGKTFVDFATVVIDTAGRALDYLTLDVIEKNAKHGAGAGNLSQQGWGALKSRFTAFKNSLNAQGKNLVFLCHGKEEKKGDQRIVRPDVQGGSLSELLKSADIIGYYHLVGKQRVIEWTPSEEWIAKSPDWPTQKVPDFSVEPNLLATVQQRARQDLGKMSAESAQTATQVAEILEGINCATGLDDLNMLVANAEALPTIVKAQIRTPLAERVKGLGAIYDKKAGKYVPGKVETAAVA
jgi:hypothetical protein